MKSNPLVYMFVAVLIVGVGYAAHEAIDTLLWANEYINSNL